MILEELRTHVLQTARLLPKYLGPEDKRHLLLLLKEALNNIAKHADARAASLRPSPSRVSS